MKRMTAEMNDDILIQALRRMAPETGSLHCLGCGYEHGCSLHGCAVINRAAERLEQLTAPAPNAPLTLEELWEIVVRGLLYFGYVDFWLPYRRKPEEGTT